MAKGGKREGAGRKKGIPNKANFERQAEIAASGLTPLDYMLSVLRDETADRNIRLDAAKAAAAYVHPKLANIEVAGKDGGALQVQVLHFASRTNPQ